MQVNYDAERGRRLKDFLLEGSVRGRVFVNTHDGNKPYILTGISTQSPYSRENNISIEEVWSGGIPRGGNLLDHLEDPEYDPSKIDKTTPNHWTVDRQKLSIELVKLVIGEEDKTTKDQYRY